MWYVCGVSLGSVCVVCVCGVYVSVWCGCLCAVCVCAHGVCIVGVIQVPCRHTDPLITVCGIKLQGTRFRAPDGNWSSGCGERVAAGSRRPGSFLCQELRGASVQPGGGSALLRAGGTPNPADTPNLPVCVHPQC